MKEVTAAIIKKDNRILIAQRAQGQNQGGQWEFPGGKIEAGETPEACLKREIMEEFRVDIEVNDKFGESIYKYETGAIKLIAYWSTWISGAFELSVHSHIAWVSARELEHYDFAPADVPFVEELKRIEL